MMGQLGGLCIGEKGGRWFEVELGRGGVGALSSAPAGKMGGG